MPVLPKWPDHVSAGLRLGNEEGILRRGSHAGGRILPPGKSRQADRVSCTIEKPIAGRNSISLRSSESATGRNSISLRSSEPAAGRNSSTPRSSESATGRNPISPRSMNLQQIATRPHRIRRTAGTSGIRSQFCHSPAESEEKFAFIACAGTPLAWCIDNVNSTTDAHQPDGSIASVASNPDRTEGP